MDGAADAVVHPTNDDLVKSSSVVDDYSHKI
jgi:hypothetical protein